MVRLCFDNGVTFDKLWTTEKLRVEQEKLHATALDPGKQAVLSSGGNALVLDCGSGVRTLVSDR